MAEDFLQIQRQQDAVFHDELSANDAVAHVGGSGRIDEVTYRVVNGCQVGLSKIHDYQVRKHPRDDLTGQPLPAQRPGAGYRCHSERRFGGNSRGIECCGLVELGARIHLPEHVQVIVARAAVRTQRHRNAGLEETRNGGDSGGKLHIAFRIMDNFHLVFGKHVDVGFVQGHAVVGYQAGVEQPKGLEMRDRAPAVQLQTCLTSASFSDRWITSGTSCRTEIRWHFFKRSGEQV